MNMAHNAKTTAKTHEDRTPKQPSGRQDAQTVPAFKPVALPALTAAMRAVQPQPRRATGPTELPAILRKDAGRN